MANVAIVGDMARNGCFDWPATKKEISGMETSLFRGLLEKLWVTDIVS